MSQLYLSAWVCVFVVGAWLSVTSVLWTHSVYRTEPGPGLFIITQHCQSSYHVPGLCEIKFYPCPQWDRRKQYWLFRVIRSTARFAVRDQLFLGFM